MNNFTVMINFYKNNNNTNNNDVKGVEIMSE